MISLRAQRDDDEEWNVVTFRGERAAEFVDILASGLLLRDFLVETCREGGEWEEV